MGLCMGLSLSGTFFCDPQGTIQLYLDEKEGKRIRMEDEWQKWSMECFWGPWLSDAMVDNTVVILMLIFISGPSRFSPQRSVAECRSADKAQGWLSGQLSIPSSSFCILRTGGAFAASAPALCGVLAFTKLSSLWAQMVRVRKEIIIEFVTNCYRINNWPI